ncbi:MAG: MOSC domain-containing protein [Phycisphaeraceae bacterium]|nr:MOSC domain-containing protein [Phycisphaeraceae bacterium]
MRIISVNTSVIREILHEGSLVPTGIFKQPATGRVRVGALGLVADAQADTVHHGGPFMAVYAFSADEYDYWNALNGTAHTPGAFGENLTIEGLDDTTLRIGDVLRIGPSLVVQATVPRAPCFKLGIAVGDAAFPKAFLARLRVGAYFRVLHEGDVGAGDTAQFESRDPAGLTISETARLSYFAKDEREAWAAAARHEALHPRWRDKFAAKAAS